MPNLMVRIILLVLLFFQYFIVYALQEKDNETLQVSFTPAQMDSYLCSAFGCIFLVVNLSALQEISLESVIFFVHLI